MRVLALAALSCVLAGSAFGQVPKDYKGKPYHDATHTAGAQAIPGRVEAALYDLGGEGIAYHDADAINHGSGELNYQPGHCEDGVPQAVCHFREKEGVDISYVKKNVDLKSANKVTPEWQQLYIGWSADGEWVNYTVDVKKPGKYKIATLYSNTSQTVEFALNGKTAAQCVLPAYPLTQKPDYMIWHTWNRTECGESTFPKAGLQLLTLRYKFGNNFAYFDFLPE